VTPRTRARRRRGPVAVQEALFEVTIQPERKYYRQIFEALARSGFGIDPLASERVVSKLFGTIWASQTNRDGAVEEVFGLSLIDYARQRRTPLMVASLRTLAVIAPVLAIRVAATRTASSLVDAGLPEPAWTPPVGAVTAGRCWAFEDVFGDQSTVIVEYAYGADLRSAPRHGIVVEVDHTTHSAAMDVMFAEDVQALVRDLRNDARHSDPMFSLRQAEPAWARAVLERAFARTDLLGVPVEPTFAELRALALARLERLPEDMSALPPATAPPTDRALDAVVADFLASPEAAGLPPAGDQAARRIVAFAGAHYPENLSRVSPGAWDVFAFDWLPTQNLTAAERDALPSVVRAWSHWGGRFLPELAREELAASVEEVLTSLT
jgi:hypothetical protein